MSSPLVSIITPLFNSEKFISETIESVLSQTYKKWVSQKSQRPTLP